MVGVQSHFVVKPNLVLRLGWGFDNKNARAKVQEVKPIFIRFELITPSTKFILPFYKVNTSVNVD